MKGIRLLLGLTVLAVSGVGCVEESFPKAGQGELIPLNISSSISQAPTKATAQGFVNNDALGLYAVNYTNSNTVAGTLQVSGNQVDNVKYVFDEPNQKWSPTKPAYYKDIKTHVDLYLYYPYQSTISDVSEFNFEVKKDQSRAASATELSGYEASDFLWGKATDIEPREAQISVELTHRLSAVEVILKEKEGGKEVSGFEAGEFDQLQKSVILMNTTRKATIDFSKGTVTPLGSAQQDGIVMSPQGGNAFRAIVIPQTVAASTNLFAITIDGRSYGFKKEDEENYAEGQMKQVTIFVKKSVPSGEMVFELGDTSIVPWSEDKNTHGGEARQYFVVNVTEPGTLGATIKAMGKNPDKIKNLKVVGNVRDDDFYFMRDSMAILEAVNMKESVVLAPKNQVAITSVYNIKDHIDAYKWFCEALGEPDIIGSDAIWYDHGNSIPMRAFNDKKTLVYFIFPEKIEVIGQSAFESSKLSGSLIIPDGVRCVLNESFHDTGIGSVVFPSELIYIGNNAFYNCSSLSGSLTLPSQLRFVGENSFSNCRFTGELHLPEKIEYIGSAAFSEPGHFTGDLKLPEKVTKLFGRTFYGGGFTGILDLNNVTTLGDFDFTGCGFSGELIIPEGILSIPDYSFGDTGFSTIKMPSSLKEVRQGAFAGLQKLNGDIIFPDGFLIIGERAFMECGMINRIILPATIQTIQPYAFRDCYNISHIVCDAIEPATVMDNAFDGVAKDNFTVEVPAQSVKCYQAEPGWSDFKRIAAHYDFSVSRERMRALNAGQTRTYILRAPANFNWSIKSKPDWITISPESGIGKADITITVGTMERTSETFEVNEGTYNSPIYQNYKGRSGEIVFQLDEEGVNYTCSFEVEQYDSDYSDGENKVLQTHTTGNGIDIIFVGDGYDAKDIAKGTFLSNAMEGYAAFFNVEPYKTYKDYFNVCAVVSQSDDSGIGTVNTVKDSKFGTYFTQNRIKVPAPEPIFSWAKKADDGVDFTKALVINLLNTSAYEGICAMYGDGSAIAFCPVSHDAYPYDFRGIIQHEAGGHGFGKLGDEYIYHNAFIQTCDCQCCDHPQGDNDTGTSYGKFKSLGWYKNLSMNGDMHQVPWAHLIYNPKYSNYVDMYEGGYMHSRGVYRSEATSCMNNNIPYYSAISRQAMVERILNIAGEEFTLEKFYANDSDAFGAQTKAVWNVPFDRTFGVDPKWSRGSEEGSVIYMGDHPDYSKIQ